MPEWTNWARFEPPVFFGASCLRETLLGGQAFRWREIGDGVYEGIFSGVHARVRLHLAELEWSLPEAEAAHAAALHTYFRAGFSFVVVRDALPWRSDAILRERLAQFPALRILRQPLGEALLAFLCSSTRQIAQISANLNEMAERFGEPLPSGEDALPTWPQLATLPEAEIRACRLGYRARYIAETARVLAGTPGWERELAALPYPAAKTRLLALPGVGEKIADCVLLFGGGHLEAFPVDTWIRQALAGWYGLENLAPAPLAAFGRAHFGPFAGYAQQVLFAGRRKR